MIYQSKHWRDWINERFGDLSKYQIDIDDEKIEYTIRSTDPKISTKIIFHFMRPDDDDVLYDIHFSGNDSKKNNVWFSHFTIDKEYRPKLFDRFKGMATSLIYHPDFIDRLEKEWLYIPLQKGWTEKIYYVGEKIYRAKLRVKGRNNENWDKNDSIPFDLIGLDYIKIWLKLGVRTEQFEFEPIDK